MANTQLDSVVQQKQEQLRYASKQKQVALSDSNFYNQSPAEQHAQVLTALEKEDASNMSLDNFVSTYAPKLGGNTKVPTQLWLQTQQEKTFNNAGTGSDIATGLGIGAANIAGSTADLLDSVTPGNGGVLSDIGNWGRETAQQLSENYSPTAQQQRAALTQATADAATKAQQQKEYLLSQGATEDEANSAISPILDQVVAGVKAIPDAPNAAITYAAEAAPSVAQAMLLGAAGKAAGLARTVTGADEALVAAQRLKNAEQGARIAAGATIASGEAGGVVSGVRQFTLGLSDDELNQIPNIDQIRAQNPDATPEQLRLAIADNASVIPALGQGLLALAVSKGTGVLDLEAGIVGKAKGLTAIPRNILGGGVHETVEEIPQSVTGQVAQNYAQQQINPDQSLSEGAVDAGIQALLGAAPSGMGAGSLRSISNVGEAVQAGKEKLATYQNQAAERGLNAVEEAINPQPAVDAAPTDTGTTETVQSVQPDPTTNGQDVKDLQLGAGTLRQIFNSTSATEQEKLDALNKFSNLRTVLSADIKAAEIEAAVDEEEGNPVNKELASRLTKLKSLHAAMGSNMKEYGATLTAETKARVNEYLTSQSMPKTEEARTQFKADIRRMIAESKPEELQGILDHVRASGEEDQYQNEVKALTSTLALKDVLSANSSDVRSGVSTGTAEFRGLENFAKTISSALNANQTNRATTVLAQLDNFINQRVDRLNAFRDTYASAREEATQTGADVVRREVPGQFQKDGKTPSYVEYNVKHKNPAMLIQQQEDELAYLQQGRTHLNNLVSAYTTPAPNVTMSAETTAPTQEAVAPVESAVGSSDITKPTKQNQVSSNVEQELAQKQAELDKWNQARIEAGLEPFTNEQAQEEKIVSDQAWKDAIAEEENQATSEQVTKPDSAAQAPTATGINDGAKSDTTTSEVTPEDSLAPVEETQPSYLEKLEDLHDYANQMKDGESRFTREANKPSKGNHQENAQWQKAIEDINNEDTRNDVLSNPVKRYLTVRKTNDISGLTQTLSKPFNEAYSELSKRIDTTNADLVSGLKTYIMETQELADQLSKTFNAKSSLGMKGNTSLRALVLSRMNQPMNNFKDADGKMTPEIIYAMAIAGTNWKYKRGAETMYNTPSQIAYMLGMDEHALDADIIEKYKFIGVKTSYIVNDLGKQTLAIAGLKMNQDTPLALESALISGIGMELLTNMFNQKTIKQNLDKQVDSDGKEKITTYVQLEDDTYFDMQENTKVRSSINKLSGLFNTPVPESAIHINKAGSANPRINSLMDVPETFRQKAKEMAAVKYRIDKTFDNFINNMGSAIKVALGYQVPEANLHYTERSSVVGKNMSIENALQRIEDTKDLVLNEESGLDSSISFNYGFTSMGRMNIKSDYLNPHLHKLHRHYAPVEDAHVTFDPVQGSNTKRGFFLTMAIAQGLGIKTDKDSLTKIHNELEKFKTDHADLIDIAEALLNNQSVNAAPLAAYAAKKEEGATLKAIMTLAQMRSGKPFETSITYEVDGMANGTSVSILQYGCQVGPDGKLTAESIKKLARAGFHVDGQITNADFRELMNGADVYEAVSAEAKKIIDKNLKQDNSKAYDIINRVWDIYNRSTAKPIVNNANYGSGDKALMSAFTSKMIEYFEREYATLLRNPEKNKAAIKQLTTDLQTLTGEVNDDIYFLPNDDIRELRLRFPVKAAIELAMSNLVGAPYVQAYDKMFGMQRSHMNGLIQMHNISADNFNEKYMTNIPAANKLLGPSLAEIKQHIRNHEDTFPSYQFSDSSSVFTGLSGVSLTNDLENPNGLSGEVKTITKPNKDRESFGLNYTKWHSTPTLEYKHRGVGPLFTVYLNDAMTIKDTKAALQGIMVWDAIYLGIDQMEQGGHELNTNVLEAAKKNNAFHTVFNKFTSPAMLADMRENKSLQDLLSKRIGLDKEGDYIQALQEMDTTLTEGRQAAFDAIQSVTQFVVPGQTTEVKPESGLNQLAFMHPFVPTWQVTLRNQSKPIPLSQLGDDFVLGYAKSQAAMGIAQLLTELVGDTSVRILSKQAKEYTGKGDGYYDPVTNTVVVASHLSPEKMNETMLHELIHAATAKAILSTKSTPELRVAQGQLIAAYTAAMNHPVAGAALQKLLKPYAHKPFEGQLAEFISLALSNDGVREIMNSIDISANQKLAQQAAKGKSLLSNLLAKISNFLSALFRIQKPVNERSLFTALIGITETLHQVAKPIADIDPSQNQVMDHIRDMNMKDLLLAMPTNTSIDHQEHLTDWVDKMHKVLSKNHSEANLEAVSLSGDLRSELNLAAHSTGVYELVGLNVSEQERLAYEITHLVVSESMNQHIGIRNTARDLYLQAKQTLKRDAFVPEEIQRTDVGYQEALERSHAIYDAIFNKTIADSVITKQLSYLPNQVKEIRSQYLEDFMSLLMTNEEVRNVVSKVAIKPTKIKVFSGNPLDVALHIVQLGLTTLNNMILGQKGDYLTKVNNLNNKLVNMEIANKQRLLSLISAGFMGGITGTNALVGATKNITLKALEKSGLLKAPVATVRFGTLLAIGALDEKTGKNLANAFNLIHNEFASGKEGLVASILSESKGVTESNVNIMKLHTLNNKLIDEESNAIRATTQEVINTGFKAPLTEAKDAGLYSLLKADVVALLDEGHTLNDLRDYLTDDATIDDTVLRLLDLVKQVTPNYVGYYQRMSENMGYMMATGVNPEFGTVLNTAYVANRMSPGMKIATPTEARAIKPLIEQMASLYAIRYSDKTHRKTAADLIREESATLGPINGVKLFLDLHKQAKADSHAKLFDNQEFLITKGYTKDMYDPNKAIQLGTESDIGEYAKQGYKPVTKLKASGLILFATNQNYLPTYNQGALSTVGLKAKGTDLRAIYQAKGTPLTRVGFDKTLRKLEREHTGLNKVRTERISHETDEGRLVPVLNNQGEIVNYRMMMSETVRNTVLGKNLSGKMALANQNAHTVMKVNSAKVNEMVVNELQDMWDKAKKTDQAKFYIPVSEDSEDVQISESYRLLPQETKDQIEQAFGGALMVRRDLLYPVLGYRQHSITNAWSSEDKMAKPVRWLIKNTFDGLFKGKGQLRAQQVESTVQAMLKEAKFTTVVKSGVIQAGNLTSNTWQLMMRGLDPISAVKDQYRGMEAAQRFIKDTARVRVLKMLMSLDSHLVRQQEYKNELLELESELAANEVKPLIDNGLMTSFVEDLSADTIADQYTKRNQLISKVDNWKAKQSKPIQSALDFITAGRKTEYTQAMLDVTRYSDLGARYALYKFMKQDNPELDEATVIRTLGNEFVNYDLPTHPVLNYLDNVGGLWFPRYYIRMQRNILNMIQKNPAMYLTELLSEQVVGNMDTPMDNGMLFKHPWDKFTLFGPITTAPMLLPAVNAVD